MVKMKIAILSPSVFASLLLSQVTIANVAFPLYEKSLPFLLFLGIITLETVVFWICAHRVFEIGINAQKVLVIILIANIITSLLGTLIFPEKYLGDMLMWTITYASTVFIEWIVYLPFFQKQEVKILDLLKISFIVNIISYALLTLVI